MSVRSYCAEYHLLSDTKTTRYQRVLIDLRARNFVHAKTYLRRRCVHARNRAPNLASPDT